MESKKFRINDFSNLTVMRTCNGRLITIFELIYGRSIYNNKVIMNTRHVLHMIEHLKAYRTIFYPSCEIILEEDDVRITKMVFHPSTYNLDDSAVTFGVWYKNSKREHLPPACFTYTLYNRHEIDNLIKMYNDIEYAYNEQTEFNGMIEKIYLQLGEEVDKSIKQGMHTTFDESLASIDSDHFSQKFSIDKNIVKYIKGKCKDDFVSFMESNYGG